MISDSMVLWRVGEGTFALTGWGFFMCLVAACLLQWIIRGD
jgi:hypothetical protein